MAGLAAPAASVAPLAASVAPLAASVAPLASSSVGHHLLTDLPQPSLVGSGLALLIDLKTAKAAHTREERAHFILDDLGVPPNALAAAFVAPITAHFLIEFLPGQEASYHSALGRLHAGVPWPAAAGRLVHGWAPGDVLTAVRVVGVPSGLDHALITAVLGRHGRVVVGPTPGKDPLLQCPDGTVQYKLLFPEDPLPLPTFISVELAGSGAGPNFVLQVYTDHSAKRCYKCAGHHLGQLCRAWPLTIASQGSLWARITTPGPLSSASLSQPLAPQSSSPQPWAPKPSAPQPLASQPSPTQPSPPQPSPPQLSTHKHSAPQPSAPQQSAPLPLAPQPLAPQPSAPVTLAPQPLAPLPLAPQPLDAHQQLQPADGRPTCNRSRSPRSRKPLTTSTVSPAPSRNGRHSYHPIPGPNPPGKRWFWGGEVCGWWLDDAFVSPQT